jgi:hypothetical protein
MRTLVVIVLALIAGFFAGIVLSEIIGIAGFVLFQRVVGIRYLPVYLAFLSAAGALAVDLLMRRRSS